MTIADIVPNVLSSGKNVLFIDTCIGLDIIRVLARVRPATLTAAIDMDEMIKAESMPYSLVTPSLYQIEASRHEQDTITEARRAISNHFIVANSLADFHRAQRVPGVPPRVVDYSGYAYETHLEALYRRISAAAVTLDADPRFERLAAIRLVNGLPPAKPGSAKHRADCQVFEEFLELARGLRSRGYGGSLTFATSNTNEYCTGSRTKPEISHDLAAVSASYAASLEEGHRLALL